MVHAGESGRAGLAWRKDMLAVTRLVVQAAHHVYYVRQTGRTGACWLGRTRVPAAQHVWTSAAATHEGGGGDGGGGLGGGLGGGGLQGRHRSTGGQKMAG